MKVLRNTADLNSSFAYAKASEKTDQRQSVSRIPLHQPRKPSNQLRQRFSFQLGKQIGAMRLHRTRRHLKRAANLFVGQAGDDQAQHFAFAF